MNPNDEIVPRLSRIDSMFNKELIHKKLTNPKSLNVEKVINSMIIRCQTEISSSPSTPSFETDLENDQNMKLIDELVETRDRFLFNES
ncbi:MAG: hypothetical protein HOF35_11145 [Bacteroidetes bacterium]|jgi:hypothetical protein|nr:hypothetical protein [Bacteroidota bacterium]MBT3934804.1 hypothetical protein [Bacteroidota bacterium]MBT7825331.1 hypothetical protein [Bacteroidota bacterium]